MTLSPSLSILGETKNTTEYSHLMPHWLVMIDALLESSVANFESTAILYHWRVLPGSSSLRALPLNDVIIILSKNSLTTVQKGTNPSLAVSLIKICRLINRNSNAQVAQEILYHDCQILNISYTEDQIIITFRPARRDMSVNMI